ncbi:hypothetical protein I4U23_006248 [Adineta vaga]|nr:hypothetical protein I4U23_006248 [Adineta vaga]
MYQYRQPQFYVRRNSPIIQRVRLTSHEKRWRRQWPYTITIILATLMLLFTLIIIILEIASLAVDNSNTYSNTASTGAGIWCSLAFLLATVCMYFLVIVYDCSFLCSLYTLVAHLIASIFICILVGLDANAVTPYNQQLSTAPTKIQILKGQLAVAILMFLFPIAYLAIFIYTAFVSRIPFQHVHANSSVRYPIRVVKY